MAKQDKSKFQLNKGTDHGFDISKGGKRKFDLTKDEDEPVVANVKEENAAKQKTTAPVESAHATSEPQPEEKKGNKALIWIAAIIVVALLAWWLWPSSSSSDVVDEPTEQVEESADVAADSVPTETTVPEEQSESAVSEEEASSTSAETNPATSAPAAESATTSVTAPVYATANVSNDIESEARKVIRGDYGVGKERKDRLGSQYQVIQQRVNELKREGAF